MNTREIAVAYRLSHWAGIMRERQESGLSIRAFCERESFHENVYYYWQRKLRGAAIEQMAKRQKPESSTALAVSGFTEVQVMERKAAQPEGLTPETIHIEISGIKITVNSSYPTEKLAALLRELSGP
ncbi:IS66 family insertion sequence element accessory protein TnpB [Tyzzerella sp. OttesenSCG-928-J15]|nr:IS66 family insertion sequence element accessory protein TnpB [Tyzzerella sp. OttesenSCG-928-J15]